MGIVTRTLANNLTTGLAGDKKGTPIIVNGDMAVAQRGASSTSDGIATCDRWNVRKTNLDNLKRQFVKVTYQEIELIKSLMQCYFSTFVCKCV